MLISLHHDQLPDFSYVTFYTLCRFLWLAACSIPHVRLVNRCSECLSINTCCHVQLLSARRGEWDLAITFFIAYNAPNSCEFLFHVIFRSPSSTVFFFSGVVMYFISDWTSFIINVMVGGELFGCGISVISFWLKYYASYRNCSVIRHVSAI